VLWPGFEEMSKSLIDTFQVPGFRRTWFAICPLPSGPATMLPRVYVVPFATSTALYSVTGFAYLKSILTLKTPPTVVIEA
jgi:hypothetical protein